MVYSADRKSVSGLKIAYVGGGSRGWAWGLMSDLAIDTAISGEVYLYDIDMNAAKINEIIGNKMNALPDANGKWKYIAVPTLKEALTGADFVVISILPGTFDEMAVDVHAPEKYGIYQSVGDSTGPGGIMRALRTIPMFKVIAEGVRDYCPNAWVINYTNPMTMCVSSLYKFFPKIKAFGCCHEVFATQNIIGKAYTEKTGIEVQREDVNVNVVGINHFTWLTSAHIGNEDVFDIYAEHVNKFYKEGDAAKDNNWMNNSFASTNMVKFDLFRRYGAIAAAGDRHLAEFCPGKWYLASPEQVKSWHFGLTTVAWRKEDLKERLAKADRLVSGEEEVKINITGEEGTKLMRGLLGLENVISNVNVPNHGQISNMPEGFVVETNATFTPRGVQPLVSGAIPQGVDALVSRVAHNQELTVEAAITGNYDLAFKAFINDPLVTIDMSDARKLFDEMIRGTSKYLPK